MPRYDTSMAGVVASLFGNIPAGHYRFKIGTAKAFQKKETKDGVEITKNFGIRYPVEVVDVIQGDGRIGDKQLVNLYQHTKDSIGYSKAVHLVLCGFDQTPEGEADYNDKFASMDFGFDTDSGEVGQAWKECEGSFFEAIVDVQKNGDQENQKWKKYIPVN